MKKIKFLFPVAVIALVSVFAACSPEDEQELPKLNKAIYFEDFEWFTQGNLDQNTWTTNVVKGTKPWKFETRNNDSYLFFSAFESPKETANDSWIVSKDINIDNANVKRLTFISTQGFVTDSTNNKLELYAIHNISETSADTVMLKFNKPVLNQGNFKWVNSGNISLSSFKGPIKIAFRVTGSGTDTNADGTYEVDNIKVF
ncbi:choice-of-anchor J domain-containing protein [Paenimyroides aestuarii]|uniref:Choice-of-anchor J domain-containing protein n=1 Tax=Paenimyroides aestuarii TaxID=2968490 RepID=A0ABY5NVB6_9FLAO|nr:choice-of-anchor J domain-containing protein [Paenimyroides aestuarii]UUV22526.1 choice-of-anchor J domain-containing protein [Paenimyroides aestuarii]